MAKAGLETPLLSAEAFVALFLSLPDSAHPDLPASHPLLSAHVKPIRPLHKCACAHTHTSTLFSQELWFHARSTCTGHR